MPKSFKKESFRVSPRLSPHQSAPGGFLLIEMIVVLSIAITLTTILSVYTRQSERQVIFFKEQTVLADALSRAKAFAIETFQPQLQPGLAAPGERICGWGVHFQKFNPDDPAANRYIIFRDLTAGSCGLPSYTPAGGEDFEIIALAPYIQISCLMVSSQAGVPCAGSRSEIDVIYLPPDPKIVFSPADPNDEEAIIVLELADGTRSSTIRVSRSGQISIE